MRQSTLFAASILALLGCHYQSPAVQLQGEPAQIARLAGKWEGEYVSGQTGRSGSIVFTVNARGDTASGDVLMVPTSGGPLVAADADSRAHAMHASSPEVLRINFVRVLDQGGYVEGALESYIAPDCHCVVTTVFRGLVDGNTIKGDYVTRSVNGLRQSGTWSVTRKTMAAR